MPTYLLLLLLTLLASCEGFSVLFMGKRGRKGNLQRTLSDEESTKPGRVPNQGKGQEITGVSLPMDVSMMYTTEVSIRPSVMAGNTTLWSVFHAWTSVSQLVCVCANMWTCLPFSIVYSFCFLYMRLFATRVKSKDGSLVKAYASPVPISMENTTEFRAIVPAVPLIYGRVTCCGWTIQPLTTSPVSPVPRVLRPLGYGVGNRGMRSRGRDCKAL